MSVSFFSENTSFQLNNKRKRKSWILQMIRAADRSLNHLNFVFCNDEYLLQVNKDYLNHFDYTDIITFDLSEEENIIEGDIFISIDRVKDNAQKLSTTLDDEIDRVMIHGVLHLIGYNDKDELSKKQMRLKEDEYLSLRS